MGRRRKGQPTQAQRATEIYLAERLYQLRLEHGLTQGEIGKMAGVTLQQWQKYERGINRISASRIAALAKALNVPLAEILGKVGQIKPPPDHDARQDRWVLDALKVLRALPIDIRTSILTVARDTLKHLPDGGEYLHEEATA